MQLLWSSCLCAVRPIKMSAAPGTYLLWAWGHSSIIQSIITSHTSSTVTRTPSHTRPPGYVRVNAGRCMSGVHHALGNNLNTAHLCIWWRLCRILKRVKSCVFSTVSTCGSSRWEKRSRTALGDLRPNHLDWRRMCLLARRVLTTVRVYCFPEK